MQLSHFNWTTPALASILGTTKLKRNCDNLIVG